MTSPTENLLTSPKGFALKATPAQRALCRVIDGVPLGELWEDETVQRAFARSQPPEVKAREVVGCAAIRSGKSMILASVGIDRARNAKLDSRFKREQPPIVPIISTRKKNAKAVLGHITALMTQPHMARYLVKAPTAESLFIWNKSGVAIEIRIVANSRAAASLTSYWHLVDLVDEVFLLPGEEDSPVNLDDIRKVVRKRLVDGGQVLYFGSPWFPVGPAYELVERYEGRPTEDCIVFHADGPSMNPEVWSDSEMERLRASKDPTDQDMLTTCGLAQFLSTIGGILTSEMIDACYATRPVHTELHRQWTPDHVYTATCDPAARRNAFTLGISHREKDKLVVDFADQWVPTRGMPLDLDVVLAEVAEVCRRYHVRKLWADQWSSEALMALARYHGLEYARHDVTDKQAFWQAVVDGVRFARTEYPRIPEIKRDLLHIQRKMTPTGPRLTLLESTDGRHADFVPMLALAWELAVDGPPKRVVHRLSNAFIGDKEPEPERDADEMVGVLRPAEHPVLDKLFGGKR